MTDPGTIKAILDLGAFGLLGAILLYGLRMLPRLVDSIVASNREVVEALHAQERTLSKQQEHLAAMTTAITMHLRHGHLPTPRDGEDARTYYDRLVRGA